MLRTNNELLDILVEWIICSQDKHIIMYVKRIYIHMQDL